MTQFDTIKVILYNLSGLMPEKLEVMDIDQQLVTAG